MPRRRVNAPGAWASYAGMEQRLDPTNPYFVCWCTALGIDAATFESRDASGDIAWIVDPSDGERAPWTIVFMTWIRARWWEWGTELGFTRGVNGDPHEHALLAGHTRAQFDAWLRAWSERAGREVRQRAGAPRASQPARS